MSKSNFCKGCNLDFSKTNSEPNSNGLCQACQANEDIQGTGSFVIDTCKKCNKVKSIEKSGFLTDKQLADEITKTKKNNNWCEGNCKQRERERESKNLVSTKAIKGE